MNYQVSIDLFKMKGAKKFTAKDGTGDYICFPIKDNHIYIGKDGSRCILFGDVVEHTSQYGDSHFISIKQGEPKEGEQYAPSVIVGNLRPKTPVSTPAPQEQPAPQATGEQGVKQNDDDLPF